MKDKLKLLKYWFEIQYHKIFKPTLPTDVIPKGYYCYEDDVKLNKEIPLDMGVWVKICPYFRSTRSTKGIACVYKKFYGFDVGLYDSCKICDINKK